MKKTKPYFARLARGSALALLLAGGMTLAGCLHSGGDGPTVSELDLTGHDMEGGADVEGGTYSVDSVPDAILAAIAAGYDGPTSAATGGTIMIGGYTLTCTAGPCSISVSDDEETFTITGDINVSTMMAEPGDGMEPEPTEPSAYDAALAAINAATTPAAAQAAYDAVDQTMITGAEDMALMEALTARQTALAAVEEAEEEARLAANAVAASMGTAITTEAAQTADAGLGGSDVTATGNAEGAYNIAVKRDRSGTTVTITVEAADDADDEDFNEVFATTDDGGTVSIQSRIHETNEDDGSTMWEQVNVFTDIEAPEETPFAEVADQALNARDLDPLRDGPDDGDTLTDDWTALTLADSDPARAAVMLPSLVTGRIVTHTYDFDVDSTLDMDEAGEVRGSYNGAMGMYRCDGDAVCTVTLDAMGAVTATTGVWVFTPDAGATSPVADTDYLWYGAWLSATTDADGAIMYTEVETFAGSSAPLSNSISAVTGSATYEGGANGQYVRNVLTSDGEIDTAMAGQFAALASLTANFGGGSIPADIHNTLTGRIHSFQLFDIEGNTHDDWMDRTVTLESSAASDTGTHTGTAVGNDMDEMGSFAATFHGSVAPVDHDNDNTTPEIVPQPHSIVGEFNSVFTDGSLAGAFGARIVEDE